MYQGIKNTMRQPLLNSRFKMFNKSMSINIKFLLIVVIASSKLILSGQNSLHIVGNKSYELTSHLGNVTTVVSNRKQGIIQSSTNRLLTQDSDIIAYSDYYPYGMLMEGRNDSNVYRYGFQGQEQDDEVKGTGKAVNYTYRRHDPRIGRFFAMDPLSEKYAYYSSYQFSGNKLINSVELEGLEEFNVSTKFSLFLNGGFSISVGLGYQEVTKNSMVALNSSLTYKRGGPGTSMLSKNLFTYSQSFSPYNRCRNRRSFKI